MTSVFTEYLTEEDAEHARRYHRAGLCPCCGSKLGEWTDNDYEVIEPQAIGEGVVLCGRCIGNKHQETPGFLEWLLLSLANVRNQTT